MSNTPGLSDRHAILTLQQKLIDEDGVSNTDVLVDPLRLEATLQDGRTLLAFPSVGRMRINDQHDVDGNMLKLPPLHDVDSQLEHIGIAFGLKRKKPEDWESL